MTARTATPIQFYFDFISPFGYFASLRIDDLARRYGREVEWTSMLVGVSVLKVMGLPPIVELPLKGPYVINDAKRYARQHQVAFERPSTSPTSRPVEAGRAFAWAKESIRQLPNGSPDSSLAATSCAVSTSRRTAC